ncbi:hypothetical protein HMPREF0580_2015 [Mobiluncus mulieris ATCC 35239]|uniref:Uncharacterized protein n=1 Tax=Mobiluncus mulieris ATCC 35239 TaxID=871571 RepID=E0QSY7_9ACTO|nr:hypothetical protein HMPREF0580_2015 [Mobiluncus mulieris ATCC 35239]
MVSEVPVASRRYFGAGKTVNPGSLLRFQGLLPCGKPLNSQVFFAPLFVRTGARHAGGYDEDDS